MPDATSWTVRATALATVCGAAVVWVGSSGTLSSWTSATVTNSGNGARSSLLAVSHSYGSSCSASQQASPTVTSCAGSPYPARSDGSARTDTITNTGTTTATTGTYRVLGCGPVSLGNTGTVKASGDLLPRTGTTFDPANGPFAGAGSITLDGTSGYASSVAATSEPVGPAVIGSASYGIGIWFKAGSGSAGALAGFGSNPLDTTGTNDRILSLTAGGALSFVASPGGAALTSTATFRDNTWHFAHVLISATRVLVVGLGYTVSLSVDGTVVASGGSGLLGALSSYSGYWHVGWSPIGGTGRYFAGSLSGFVVDDSGSAVAPTSKPTAYSSGTERWRLDDSGGASDGTTISGVLPSGTALPGGAAEPCTVVTVSWPLIATTSTLRALVTAGTQSAAAPAPGASQSSVITLTTIASPPAYDRGLLLYAPLRADYGAGTSTSWVVSFLWSSATVVIA